MIKFTVPLTPVSKKNNQQIAINKATGRPFVVPSKKYREYEKKRLMVHSTQAEAYRRAC